jgi:hypothetical protein
MIKSNEGLIDRVARVTIGALALVVGGFWLGDTPQIVAYIIGMLISVTGFMGFCGLYAILKIQTCNRNEKPLSVKQLSFLIILFLVLFVGGGFISNTITKKKFLEEYGKMNGFYKQTLFLTGQSKRNEAIANYESWKAEFTVFSSKYSTYKPFVLRNDKEFNNDLLKISNILTESKTGVYSGDLPATHKKLEEVRPLLQAMFKRNGFSMFALTLTDFHDAMEKNIEAADAKNSEEVIKTYEESNKLLMQIEAESQTADIKAIRANLDDLLQLAKDGKKDELSKKAATLKSSFVKVYLQKG